MKNQVQLLFMSRWYLGLLCIFHSQIYWIYLFDCFFYRETVKDKENNDLPTV